jgi:hypothetical protein
MIFVTVICDFIDVHNVFGDSGIHDLLNNLNRSALLYLMALVSVISVVSAESGIFLKEGGESNRHFFSLKLKLDDFTSGFRNRYADMAGGWEETSQLAAELEPEPVPVSS